MPARSSAAAALLALVCASTAVAAFEITSPSADNYWVACSNNTLAWTANSTDAGLFSVALIDTSNTPTTPSLTNGAYLIANSLRMDASQAVIELNCVSPASTYQLLFVNASQYELEHPEVYFYGSNFEIKPNGTAPASSGSNSNGAGAGTGSGNGMNTVVSPSASSTPAAASPSTSPSGGASARVGMAASVLFGAALAAAVAVVA